MGPSGEIPATQLKEVRIYNRNTGSAYEISRLSNSIVSLWNENGEIIAQYILGSASWSEFAITANDFGLTPVNSSPTTSNPTLSPTPVLPVNLALEAGAVASQSTTCYGGVASRAIDGNTNGSWRSGSVQHTCNEANPWWMVTLDQSHAIYKVILHNRSDCCSDRLANSQVQILDDSGAVVTSQAISGAELIYTFDFDGVVGSSVRVWKAVYGSLNIAEVEIMGSSFVETSPKATPAPTDQVINSFRISRSFFYVSFDSYSYMFIAF